MDDSCRTETHVAQLRDVADFEEIKTSVIDRLGQIIFALKSSKRRLLPAAWIFLWVTEKFAGQYLGRKRKDADAARSKVAARNKIHILDT